ncbi:thump domain containing protein 1-related [Holotrichia oblita]|uniref:Thump domain containing protein 1-related n=1 Tax=Holotrichia oblita TaxID=644536 RepID=A0ACB9TQ31_HOLOL|nr:thump domain containing protein 1-related [Holotrichia oblita]
MHYGEKILPKEAKEANNSSSEPLNESKDIEAELQDEIASLKSDNQEVKHSERLFQVIESGAKNFLFIRAKVVDPVALASSIVEDIAATKQLQTRHLIRLVPVEITCKAYIDNIKKACSELLERHFKDSAKTFSIVYNHRNNNTSNLTRDVVITQIANLVNEYRNDHVVDLTNAEVTIVVEVIKSIALLAVIPKYLFYKKFNLHAIGNKNDTQSSEQEGIN